MKDARKLPLYTVQTAGTTLFVISIAYIHV